MNSQKKEKQELIRATLYPSIFIVTIWLIKGIEVWTNSDFAQFGIYPLHAKGLQGILFAPLIHGGYEHLFNNSVPIFVLGSALFFFFRPIAFRVIFLSYIIHGFWLWFFARGSYHIGASGIIYSLGAFLFTSGVIRKNTKLLAIAMIVAFEYGSMVWGIFPMEERISWEGHLTGMVAGIVLAIYFKGYGPQANIGLWKTEMPDEPESEEEDAYWNNLDELDEEERKLVE